MVTAFRFGECSGGGAIRLEEGHRNGLTLGSHASVWRRRSQRCRHGAPSERLSSRKYFRQQLADGATSSSDSQLRNFCRLLQVALGMAKVRLGILALWPSPQQTGSPSIPRATQPHRAGVAKSSRSDHPNRLRCTRGRHTACPQADQRGRRRPWREHGERRCRRHAR